MSRFRSYPGEAPAPVDVATLAGAAQLGRDGGSGMVATHNAFTDPDAANRVAMLGRQPITDTTQLGADLPPASTLADRQLYGGVTTFPAFWEYQEGPGMTGGYGVLTGRAPGVVFDGGGTEDSVPAPSFREAPLPQVCRRIAGEAARVASVIR